MSALKILLLSLTPNNSSLAFTCTFLFPPFSSHNSSNTNHSIKIWFSPSPPAFSPSLLWPLWLSCSLWPTLKASISLPTCDARQNYWLISCHQRRRFIVLSISFLHFYMNTCSLQSAETFNGEPFFFLVFDGNFKKLN